MSGIPLTGELVAQNGQGFALMDANALRGGSKTFDTKAAAIAMDARRAAEGGLAYVKTYKRFFRTVLDGAQTPVEGKILQGSGFQLVALDIPDPLWTEQGTYYVSAASGDDEATGEDDTHPVKTIDEVMRRVNRQTFARNVNVIVLDGNVGDVRSDLTLESVKGIGETPYQFRIMSDPGAWTVLAAGTLDAGTLPLATATDQANTLVATAAIFNSTMLHARVRMTSGTNAGAVAHIDSVVSGTTVTTKTFQIFALDTNGLPTGSISSFDKNPTSGDTFVVEAMPACGTLDVRLKRHGRGSDVSGVFGLVVDGFDVGGAEAFPYAGSVYLHGATNDLQMVMQRCVVRYPSFAAGYPSAGRLQGVTFVSVAGKTPVLSGTNWLGGGITGDGGVSSAPGALFNPGGRAYGNSYNLICRGLCGPVVISGVHTGGMGIFQSAGDALWLKILYGSQVLYLTGSNRLFGTGNVGYGIVLEANSQVVYDTNKPTVSGAAGQTLVGGVDVPYSAHPTMRADKLCGLAVR